MTNYSKNTLRTISTVTAFFILTLFVSGCSTSKSKKSYNKGNAILSSAKSQLGKKYKFGGISPKTGFDCSGLAYWAHKTNGITIPRQSFKQYKSGAKVKFKNLKKGDLLFYTTYKRGPSHVGIYYGNDSFIHSPNSNKSVEITSMKNSYWKKRYLGARRYF